MTVDQYEREVQDGWADTVADAHAALEPLRQQWRDEDREVDLDDDYRDEAA